ncbi:glutamine synthetase family protein [Alistipes sp. OttesenSCG-928-B03]|nr:glutamine synthetase family protein [Alistipes sp. OttesenSCG-928-B03]
MDQRQDITAAPLSAVLGKPAAQFTRADMLKFAADYDIRMVNFMYPAGDGRLKTLNFVIDNQEYLESILTCGERVDGSSLFRFIEAGSSDLYVVPRYRTAFIDPFATLPTLCFLCSFFNKDGQQLESSPEYTLHKAAEAFSKTTGMTFEAMGELEYYVVSPLNEELKMFPAVNQRGYHESGPFAKFNQFRADCMYYIANCGGQVKYGHSEVGNFTLDGKIYEQNEIEFLPTNVEDAADQLVVAKWIIRNLAYTYGYDVSFAPKITEGKAGSGLHVHMRLMKDGKNVMLDGTGKLSEQARTMIAGLMTLAPSITAFGNVNPTSYFRLVPHQEAPTNICWGDRNRSVLVRVPLGWTSKNDMSALANPVEKAITPNTAQKQTVEIRSADGSADVYQLLAAVCVAARYGFELPDALKIAERTYVDVNIHSAEHSDRVAALEQLPDSCEASSAQLERQRAAYEAHGVFDARMIDSLVETLRAFADGDIRARIKANPELMAEMVAKYYYCG